MSQPGPSATPATTLPEPTAGQAVKLLVNALSRLIHPSIAGDIIRAAATEAGLSSHVDAYLAELQPPAPAAVKGKRGKKLTKDGKDRRGRAAHPFTIFVAKAMERIKEHPAYHQRSVGSDGKAQRGMSMTMAGLIWKGLSEDTKEEFARVYQPLCDELKSEVDAGASKPDLKSRLQAFEQSNPGLFKDLMQRVLPDKLPPSLADLGSASVVLPAGAVDEEDSEESSDDEEEDDEDEEAKRKEEERKAQEAAAQKAKEEAERKKVNAGGMNAGGMGTRHGSCMHTSGVAGRGQPPEPSCNCLIALPTPHADTCLLTSSCCLCSSRRRRRRPRRRLPQLQRL